MIDGNQNRIRTRAIDGRLGRQRRLHDLVVFRGNALQRNAMARGAGPQRRHYDVEYPIAEHAQPERNQRVQRLARSMRAVEHPV